MKLSVIIPTLNEAAYIGPTLDAVRRQTPPFELVVADGGSADDTLARAAQAATILHAPRGRAVQMNHGAAQATGEVLLFLHADTRLPPDAFEAIRATLQDPAAEAGAFRLAFDTQRPLLRFYSLCTRWPSPKICFGDRGLFVRRPVFEALGGFPEIPLFEDLEMVRRLHARGGFRFLTPHVTTSARRFDDAGPLRQQARNTYLWLHYLRGTDPHRLVHLYRYQAPGPS